MTEARRTVRLYEALELRGEYDARIKTLRDCLPESRQNRGLFSRESDSSRRPAPGFSVSGAREQLRALECKRRKLNAAIQRANFEHRLQHEGDDLSLTEALETRKALNERLGELHSQVVDSAYERIFHKRSGTSSRRTNCPTRTAASGWTRRGPSSGGSTGGSAPRPLRWRWSTPTSGRDAPNGRDRGASATAPATAHSPGSTRTETRSQGIDNLTSGQAAQRHSDSAPAALSATASGLRVSSVHRAITAQASANTPGGPARHRP